MISYQDVIDNELIDDEILEYIPRHCECGGEIEFTESLKQIACNNPKCYFKVASRLENMCKSLKVDGFGESSCIKICRDLKMISPFQALLIGNRTVDGVSSFKSKIDNLISELKKPMELWEMVALCNIPGIDSISYKLFGKYSSIEDAYKDFEKYQVPYIASLLGNSGGVMSANIYNMLMQYKAELQFAESECNIKKLNVPKISIAISETPTGFGTKASYVARLNEILNGKASILLSNTVTKEISYLVCSPTTNTGKVKKANSLISNGADIKIVDSQELIDILINKFS
jgi:hypothetical protein